MYDHSSLSDSLQTVCEQCEAPVQRDKDLISVILCFYEIWGTDLHVNTKSELMTGLIAKAAKIKIKNNHPLITEVMVSILYYPN